MVISTTSTLDNAQIVEYKGLVFGEVVSGVDFIKDFGASIRNFIGGRSQGYEEELIQAREDALSEMEQRAAAMGANAIVGVDVDYEVLGQGNMLMVSASGTAVVAKAK
ncbi:MAG: heavy metal-binding domain-containing protein [Clostridia bacterium]|nr:heavy metal-binding domain-containing protein [Clostridia bacterium]